MPQPTHTAADVTGQLLIDLGLGSDVENGATWPVHVNSRPDLPDSLLSVTDTQGLDGGRLMVTKERQEYPGVQVQIRAAKQQDAVTKTKAVADGLDGVLQRVVTLQSSRYLVHSLQRTGPPLSLGREPTTARRSSFTVNLLVTLTQQA